MPSLMRGEAMSTKLVPFLTWLTNSVMIFSRRVSRYLVSDTMRGKLGITISVLPAPSQRGSSSVTTRIPLVAQEVDPGHKCCDHQREQLQEGVGVPGQEYSHRATVFVA